MRKESVVEGIDSGRLRPIIDPAIGRVAGTICQISAVLSSSANTRLPGIVLLSAYFIV